MASTTGDGAEQPEASSSTSPAAAAAGPPNGSRGDAAAAPSPVALPPPVAVPTVRAKPERSIKGQTTASDYVAPRELPTNTPRPVETAAAKVVIDVPDAPIADEPSNGGGADPEVAEARQRRRAPTLKIERSAVKELKQLDDARIARAEAAVAALAAAQAQAAGHPLGPPSARSAGLAPDTPRQLARPASDRPGPRSGSRTAGWVIALVATAVVGGGALAVGMGWVPGLAPSDDASPGAMPTTSPTTRAPAPTAEPTVAPTPTVDAAPTQEPIAEPEPSASAAEAASSASAAPPRPTYGAPWPGGRHPSRPPPAGPRPRPKSDIPQGI